MSNRANAVVGWFALSGLNAVCDGDACVIAGSEATMRAFLSRVGAGAPSTLRVQRTSGGEILAGLRLGAAYAFDEEAYTRFVPLAQQAGLGLGPEEFSAPGPAGHVHLVRVQWRRAGLFRSVARELSRVVRGR